MRFIGKIEVLKLIEEMEVVRSFDLFDYLDMTLKAAVMRIYRMNKAGLIEPLGSEKGKWVLSVKGYEHLAYLKKREDAARGRTDAGSA